MHNRPVVWVDFENAPHVWVLSPITKYLEEKGYPVLLTARNFSYTVRLCQRVGYDAQVVGWSGSGKGRVSKALRLLERALCLSACMLGRRKSIGLALSHGSRSQILAAHYLGIPSVSLDDYEFSDQTLVRFVNHLLVPFPIPKETWGRYSDRVTHYSGLKEELYLCRFVPDEHDLEGVGRPDQIKVLFRPEGRFAHYRSKQSEILQEAIWDYLGKHSDILVALLPRDTAQAEQLADLCAAREISYWIPQRVLDGPSLIWNMDAVIGGGGTMTREAATLGVPAYSFFAGQWGAVDRYLKTQGRLVQIATVDNVRKILLRQRERVPVSVSSRALDFVTGFVEDVIGQ